MDHLTGDLKQRVTETEALALVQALDAAGHRCREVFAEVGVRIEPGEPARTAALFAADGQPALDRLVALAWRIGRGVARPMARVAETHRLGLQVTAEGIERDEEWAVSRQSGCDLGQGWLFTRPMPAAAAIDWLAARESHDAVQTTTVTT